MGVIMQREKKAFVELEGRGVDLAELPDGLDELDRTHTHSAHQR